MNTPSTKENWDRLADFDALWTVLTDPSKKGGKWDREEFLQTGRDTIDALIERLGAAGIAPRRDNALDFACGVGRLSQALARHFRHVVGVDISSSMIAQGEALNAGGRPVTFVLGNEQNLPLADRAFDFIVTLIALQHMPRPAQTLYLKEFMRVLRPGGIAVFQTPSRHVQGIGESFFGAVDTGRGESRIELHCFPRAAVEATIREAGGEILRVEADASVGDQFESFLYVVRRLS